MSHFSKKQAGFTLVELVVTIAIISIILGTLALSQSKYSARVAINNAADNMASLVSQAHAYGVGVKEFTPGSSEFDIAYGLAFNRGPGGSSEAYIRFADRPTRNGIYDGTWDCVIGGTSECLEKIALPANVTMSQYCILRTGGVEDCSQIRRVYVVFLRPTGKASFLFFNNSGSPVSYPDTIGAKIKVSNTANEKSILIYNSGQVSVI